jgi:hypothetical protein
LPEADVVAAPTGHLVVVTDCFEQTLHDRFEACQAAGLPGVPRDELLDYLRAAAEALNALRGEHGLAHLGLSPRRLLLDQGRLLLADFGLVALVWLPSGQPAGQLGARYAAPELLEGRAQPTSDQYSLALIYAEMLTGIHPRPPRSAPKARRQTGPPGPRPAAGRTALKVDLDLLPNPDRDTIARALHAEAARRFPSCVALARALAEAGAGRPELAPSSQGLPPVISLPSLFGEPPPPGLLLPPTGQIVAALAAPAQGPSAMRRGPDARYTVGPDGVWEYRCPARLPPGTAPLKVEGFRQQWGARRVHDDGKSFRFFIPLNAARRLWEVCTGRQPHLEVELLVRPPEGTQASLSEVQVRLRPVGGAGTGAAGALEGLAPQLFDSLRTWLMAGPEQRAWARWPCRQPLRVYPALPGPVPADAIEGVGHNISYGGVGFHLAQPPPSSQIYLHWHAFEQAAPYAVLARVVRVRGVARGGYEVGAAFPGQRLPGS